VCRLWMLIGLLGSSFRFALSGLARVARLRCSTLRRLVTAKAQRDAAKNQRDYARLRETQRPRADTSSSGPPDSPDMRSDEDFTSWTDKTTGIPSSRRSSRDGSSSSSIFSLLVRCLLSNTAASGYGCGCVRLGLPTGLCSPFVVLFTQPCLVYLSCALRCPVRPGSYFSPPSPLLQASLTFSAYPGAPSTHIASPHPRSHFRLHSVPAVPASSPSDAWPHILTPAIAQPALLLSLALPLYSVLKTSSSPSSGALNIYDAALILSGLTLVGIEHVSDNAMYEYQNAKHASNRDMVHPPKTTTLSNGPMPTAYPRAFHPGFITSSLFKYSRHPNFAAEQLFWFNQALFAVNAGFASGADKAGWLKFGLIFAPSFSLSLLFCGSTLLTEWITSGKVSLVGG